MPSLPHSFILSPVSPGYFAEMLAKLKAAPRVRVQEIDARSGEAMTPDISFTYGYDGTNQAVIAITAAHSFAAKLASEATIESRLRAMIGETT